MSSRNEHRRPGHPPRSREERLRERVLQQFVRKWELDDSAEQTLRAIFGQCSFRFNADGRFSFRLPSSITVNQQIRVAMPLRSLAKDYRERVIRQLERIENIGGRIGLMVRGSLANPLVFLAGKSPFDSYLTVCRNSGMQWGILRALQHLRDVITVTEEQFFTDPSRVAMNWRLHWDRITPAMLHEVEKCLRPVDAEALHSPACKQWLAGIQQFFEQVKAGAVRIAQRPEAKGREQGAGSGEQGAVSGERGAARARFSAAEGLQGWHDGLEMLRQYLLPHYLDLSPEDFAALCRGDADAADFARRLGGALERFAARCLRAVRRKSLEDCAGSAQIGLCLRQLTELAASFHSWLEGELPQEENTIGHRLVGLAESSLVGGLFLLYLQQHHGELCRGFSAGAHGDAARRAETNRAAADRTSIIHAIEASLHAEAGKGETPAAAVQVVRRCQDATAALLRLARAAGTQQGAGSGEQGAVAGPPLPAPGKLAHRFLSAEAVCAGASTAAADYMILAEYEPGDFPAMRCRFYHRATETEANYEEVGLCRFSRRGGVAFSSEIAIPVATLFGPESPLARIAEFVGAEADRQLATWRQLAKNSGVRQCLPYLENHGAQAARIRIHPDAGVDTTLIALPSAAMAGYPLAGDVEFAQKLTLAQAIEQSAKELPVREALLRAVDSHWREQGTDPADYSLMLLVEPDVGEEAKQESEEELQRRRRVRRFLNRKNRWPLEEAEQILKALGIVIESKAEGAPHGKVRFNQRHHTLSSKLLKDGQVYARYLHEWIVALGQEQALADLIEQNDPRLAPYMRNADAWED